jgi:hypothetical protein
MARSSQGHARIRACQGWPRHPVQRAHIEADGATVFQHACKLGLEGIVSKRKDSPYRSGRSPDWQDEEPDGRGGAAGGGRGLGSVSRRSEVLPYSRVRSRAQRAQPRFGGAFAAGRASRWRNHWGRPDVVLAPGACPPAPRKSTHPARETLARSVRQGLLLSCARTPTSTLRSSTLISTASPPRRLPMRSLPAARRSSLPRATARCPSPIGAGRC